MGAGVIIETLEPIWFGNVVMFHLGVGCVLVRLGLLKGGKSRQVGALSEHAPGRRLDITRLAGSDGQRSARMPRMQAATGKPR